MAFVGRQADRRRPLERGVLVEAALDRRIRSSTADAGTSVEIFHGNHGQLETRSPVYTFIPYTINGKPYLIAELHLHAAGASSRWTA